MSKNRGADHIKSPMDDAGWDVGYFMQIVIDVMIRDKEVMNGIPGFHQRMSLVGTTFDQGRYLFFRPG